MNNGRMETRSLLLSSQVYANLCEETGMLNEVRGQEAAELQARLERVRHILGEKARVILRMAGNMCDCEALVKEVRAFEAGVCNSTSEMNIDPQKLFQEEALESGFAAAIEPSVREARARQITEASGKPAAKKSFTTIAQYQDEQRQLELELDMLQRLSKRENA